MIRIRGDEKDVGRPREVRGAVRSVMWYAAGKWGSVPFKSYLFLKNAKWNWQRHETLITLRRKLVAPSFVVSLLACSIAAAVRKSLSQYDQIDEEHGEESQRLGGQLQYLFYNSRMCSFIQPPPVAE